MLNKRQDAESRVLQLQPLQRWHQHLPHRRPHHWRLLEEIARQPDITVSPSFPPLSPDELLHLDLATTGLSPSGRHPLDAHRSRLRDLGCTALGSLKHGQAVWTAGLVVARQRPPTAAGFAFYVFEDGMHRVQAIISPDLWEAHRQLLRGASVLIVQGVAAVNGRSVTLRVERLCGMLGQ